MALSAFKNRAPQRKYRQRIQPSSRQHLGFLQKKQDYKQRSKNYHEKQQKLNKLKLKANTKNEDQFYFKMINAKKTQSGIHIQQQDPNTFDEKQLRTALKTQNYTLVNTQRSILQNKITKLKPTLQLISQHKPNTHKIFINTQNQFNNFQPHSYFHTSKQLIQNNLLEINPKFINQQAINQYQQTTSFKQNYNLLSQYIQKQFKLTKLMLKIGYEKNLLGKERKIIKKNKNNGNKVHKYFIQRKK